MSHTNITYINQFPTSPWASALDRYIVSALRSRVGWAAARNNKQTNERLQPAKNTQWLHSFLMRQLLRPEQTDIGTETTRRNTKYSLQLSKSRPTNLHEKRAELRASAVMPSVRDWLAMPAALPPRHGAWQLLTRADPPWHVHHRPAQRC